MVVGGVITLVMVAVALVSLVWTPYDPAAISIPDRLQPPSALHWLGTDHFGRDVLSMLMDGARNSMAVALIAVGVGVGIGVPLGLLAAARRGWLDEVVMRVNDLVFAFPALLLAIMITALLGPGAFNAILAIGIFNVPVFARLTRGAALSLWTRDYVLAARVAGKGRVADLGRAHPAQPRSTRWWCRRPSSSRSASWPRRRSPMSASARSRRRRAGAGCWPTRRP